MADKRHLLVHDTGTNGKRQPFQGAMVDVRHQLVQDTEMSKAPAGPRHLNVNDTSWSKTLAYRRHQYVQGTLADERHHLLRDTGILKTPAGSWHIGRRKTQAGLRHWHIEDTSWFKAPWQMKDISSSKALAD
ncbi:Hypothetical protein NTJ_11841 [Nesidiocoris tenuis]|uniref:Uncharacterized protein n=1 Tax=Nesidiocoris tenuis TaxID=355587 RepID=A0ABN7B3N9_9HEMI|nr:Hypothetical protein NTJ_11841 [Nesidiocoris tenuis]